MPLLAEAWSHWSPAPGVGGMPGSLHVMKMEQFIDQGPFVEVIKGLRPLPPTPGLLGLATPATNFHHYHHCSDGEGDEET